MIKSITVTNHLGESLKLELTRPDLSGFVVSRIEGLGPAQAVINTDEVCTNDGGLFNSARLNTRNIVLDLIFFDGSGESIEEIRHKSYKYFPTKRKVKLTVDTDIRASETEGYVEHNEPDIFSSQEGCRISIICPNPYMFSAGDVNTTVFSGAEPAFEFPFYNDSIDQDLLLMGTIEIKTERVIVYDGDGEVGITIVIHAVGTASNISIYNVGTREVMRIDTDKLASLTGSGVIAGDTITITTSKNNKTITLLRDGKETNILNCLSRDSDWFQLSKGDNIFAYTAETGNTSLQFRIENRVIYEGV